MKVQAGPFVLAFDCHEPAYGGPLTVFAISSTSSKTEQPYYGYVQANQRGWCTCKEIFRKGQVEGFLIKNRADKPVLLVNGQIIKGAAHNYSLKRNLLIEADAQLTLAVDDLEAFSSSHSGRHTSLDIEDPFTVEVEHAMSELRKCFVDFTCNGLIVFQRERFVAFEYVSDPTTFRGLSSAMLYHYCLPFLDEDARFFREINIAELRIMHGIFRLRFLEELDKPVPGVGTHYATNNDSYWGTMLSYQGEPVHIQLVANDQDAVPKSQIKPEKPGRLLYERLTRALLLGQNRETLLRL